VLPPHFLASICPLFHFLCVAIHPLLLVDAGINLVELEAQLRLLSLDAVRWSSFQALVTLD
jgi:hypothetical protein